ncbi:MAG: FlgK family flagellar hook-associated protein [Alphaproteobacteria bacterium]|jgi:flagellar hook-associated protein 1 FlgK|nr:hypothetical protein [Candidatus Jidaibacter sp.]
MSGSLGAVYTSSLSSMDRSKKEFAVASHNIANASNKDASKINLNSTTRVIAGLPQGVDIASVSIFMDESLENSLLDKISKDSYNSTIKSLYTQATTYFGDPNDQSGLDVKVTNLFSSIEELSRNPSSSSLKLMAVESAASLSDTVSEIASNLQKLRLNIDYKLGTSIDELNSKLDYTYNTAVTMHAMPKGTLEVVDAQDKLRAAFEGIAEYFSLYRYQENNGSYKLFTTQGDTLMGDIKFFLKYEPLASVDSLINDIAFNPIKVSAVDGNNIDTNINQIILPGGKTGEIPIKYDTGSIGALLKMRDVEIPKLLDQLDLFAHSLKEQMNLVHNEGNGYPPPTVLTGSRAIKSDAALGFTGNFRLAVVDDNGNPYSNIDALTLDLSKLDSGGGAGHANFESIMQEINYHFGNKMCIDKSISLGNLSDIRLASLSKNISASGLLNLDFELDNKSNTGTTFNIVSVTATDALANNILGSFNNTSTSVSPGLTSRTGASGPSISLNLPASIDYPFTIDAQVQVNDGTTSYISTLRYIINSPQSNPINGFLDQRFAVSSKVNVIDPGIINNPSLTAPVISAYMVDDSGSTIAANSGVEGFLKIQSGSKSYHLAIDSLDSKHNGDAPTNQLATGLKFSAFFGLNDLFVRTDSGLNSLNAKNAAYFMGIRDDIKDNPSHLSKANLSQVNNFTDPTQAIYQYELTDGNNNVLEKFLDLARSNVFFVSAGGLSSTEVTLSQYASNIIGFAATQNYSVNFLAEQSSSVRNALQDKLQNLRGVDINEEMVNMIIFQQSFAASAKAIQTANRIYDILFEAF